MKRDRVSVEKRSEIMSKIRSTRTKPELLLKEVLDSLPFVIVYQPRAPFRPDFIVAGKLEAIFCDGDFWHGYLPVPLDPFWVHKISRNIMRDREANDFYMEKGWDVLRISDSAVLKMDRDALRKMLHAHIDSSGGSGRLWSIR